MKKRQGFTLVEVIITIMILGIIAALVIPALNNLMQKSKVGPSLRKFISSAENANEHILASEDENVLSKIVSNDTEAYLNKLKKYMKGDISSTAPTVKNYLNSTVELPENGRVFDFESGGSIYANIYEPVIEEGSEPTGGYKGNCGTLYYDLNGFGTEPNILGKDIFVFYLDDGGFVIPRAGKVDRSAYPNHTDNWSTTCNETSVTNNGLDCAGSVADNEWKVVYKY